MFVRSSWFVISLGLVLGNSASAVEQAVMTVAMQMNEGSVRHKGSLAPVRVRRL